MLPMNWNLFPGYITEILPVLWLNGGMQLIA